MKKILGTLAVALPAIGFFFFLTTSSAAQHQQGKAYPVFCSPDLKHLEVIIYDNGEELLFSGTSTVGVPFRFYANEETWTVVFFNGPPQGWCTGPAFGGEVTETPLKGLGV